MCKKLKSPPPKNVRVLQVCRSYFSAKMLIMPLAEELRKHGFDVEFAFKADQKTSINSNFSVHNINIPKLSNVFQALFHLSKIWDYRRIFKMKDFCIVHTHTPVVALLANIATRLFSRAKLVYSVHGLYCHEKMNKVVFSFFFSLEWLSLNLAHHVFFVSEEDYKMVASRIPRLKNRISYIGNGIDVSAFYPRPEKRSEIRQELSISPDQVVITQVGRTVWEKGYNELAEATERVVRTCPQIKVLIVGDGLQGTEIRKKFENLNLQAYTSFLGFRNDIPELLSASDIFILPSYREGMPLSILEAMACGLPVICTDIRGSREVVVHNETGIIVPVKNSQKLSEAMLLLVQNQQLRVKMGRNGRKRVGKQFVETEVLSRQIKIYDELMNRRSFA